MIKPREHHQKPIVSDDNNTKADGKLLAHKSVVK